MYISEEYLHLIWYVTIFLSLFFVVLTIKNIQMIKTLSIENDDIKQKIQLNPIENVVKEIQNKHAQFIAKIKAGQLTFKQLNKTLTDINEPLKLIDVGLTPPTFKFDDSETLKKKIELCINVQFDVIRKGEATTAFTNWEWFGSKEDGTMMVNAYRDLLLKAFNAEFDVIRKQMRYSSYDKASVKIYKLNDQLITLGETANVQISPEYFHLKIKELVIWHSELQHKEDLKQARKAEQALLRKQASENGTEDIDIIENKINHSKSDITKAKKLAQELYGSSAVDMALKIARMQEDIDKLEQKFERATSQAQLTKAGYIYVISNIGSFGEGIVKIGMTRRLEPMDRVKELGDASVPFKFDVHTLSFVSDAPEIEKSLHRHFDDKRVNVENFRKEFFRVCPQEVADVMHDMKIESDWYFDVEAKEYRESLLIRKTLLNSPTETKNVFEQLPMSI